MKNLRSELQILCANQRGATAVIVAIGLSVLILAAAFGVEAGFWTYRHRLLQQQADAAAFAGAVEMIGGGSSATINTMVNASLTTNGFRDDIGTFTALYPPTTGPFTGKKAVEVSVEEDWPRLFSSIIAAGNIRITAQATAKPEDLGEACLLALDPNASSAVNFSGTSDVTLDGCSVVANSNAADAFTLSGAGQLSASCAGSVGGISTTSTGMSLADCSGPRERIPPISDPYASVPEPTVSGACKTPNLFDGSPSTIYYISGGRYCGLTIKRTVNLAAGMYIVDGGDLTITSTATVKGSGVTFFLTNGARLIIDGGASIDISAPTSGTYSGLLIFADRSGTSVTHTLSGSASSMFSGAIYMPNDELDILGSNIAAAGCTQFIARTLDLRGTSGAGIACDSSKVSPLVFLGRVRLVG